MKLKVKIPSYGSAKYGKLKEGDTFDVPNEDADRYLESGAFEKVTTKKKRKVNK